VCVLKAHILLVLTVLGKKYLLWQRIYSRNIDIFDTITEDTYKATCSSNNEEFIFKNVHDS
jgi:hypothetical protein